MGVLPKNVASQTTTEYKFKAHVGKGGSVQTMPVNNKQLRDMERAEDKEYKEGVADSPERSWASIKRLTLLVRRAIVDGVVGDVKTKYPRSGDR